MLAGVDPAGFFRRRAASADPCRLLFPGLGEVVFFSTAAAAQDILTAPTTMCEAPTPNPIEAVVGPASLILLSGEQHRSERSRMMPAFHSERIKSYTEVIAAATRDEIRTLRPGQSFGVHQLAVAIALHVAIRVVFSVDDPDRRARYSSAIKALMQANTAPLMLVPALRRELGGRGPWARLLRLRDDLDRLLTEDMAGRRRCGEDTDDMLDVLLSATDDHGRSRSGQQVHDQLRTLLAAGHETSATALAWALYHIFADDEVHERVVDELATASTPSELPALPYLGAVIKETLRMHPPVPIVLRRLTDSITVAGEEFHPGQIVGVALFALHYNPAIWRDPDRFDPDRFVGRRGSPFEYAPFGGGYRRCIGATFASSELAVAIGTIMSCLDLRMPDSERTRRPPGSVARGIAVAPSRDVRLDVVGRRSVEPAG
jgi:cytochrome P450